MRTGVILLFLIAEQAHSQNSSSRSQEFIDSLLDNKKMSKATNLYSGMNNESKTFLKWKISVIDTIDELSCQDICNSFALQKRAYDSTRIPTDITTIYEIASQFIEKDNLRDAVKTFYIAFALKKNFIEQEKERLLINYELTQKYHRENNNEMVKEYISIFDNENRLSPAFNIVEKDLNLERFYSSLKIILNKNLSELEYEQTHADYFDNSLNVELGFSTAVASRRRSPSILVNFFYYYRRDTTFQPIVLSGNQQQIITFFPTISLSYKIEKAFRLSLEFYYQEIEYRNFATLNNIIKGEESFNSNTLKIKAYQLSLTTKYLFRSNVGLRPFIELGIGVNRNTTEQKKLLKISESTFYAIEQKNLTVVLPIVLGTEYVSDKNSGVYYGAKFGGYYYLSNNAYTGEYSLSASLMFNVVIL